MLDLFIDVSGFSIDPVYPGEEDSIHASPGWKDLEFFPETLDSKISKLMCIHSIHSQSL